MKTNLITALPILSLALILGSCGPINETYDTVEFTESTTAETTTSVTTALTSPVTTVCDDVSTVTVVDSTPVLTSVIGTTTAVGTVTMETEAEKQHDNPQDKQQVNMQDNMQDKAETTTVHNDTTGDNDSKSSALTTAITTTVTETKTTDITITTTVAETTEVVTTENNEPYLVYKPSTKYVHRSTCRWNSGDAYRCDDFSQLETRICNECKPEIGEHVEYQTQTVSTVENMGYVGSFTATYYPQTAYYPGVCGGSGRTLLGYDNYDNGIRGSIASRSLWSTYGYDRNGRTTVYLEFPAYPEMDGYYFLDDCSAYCGIIDVFVWSEWSCPFGQAGVISAECWA